MNRDRRNEADASWMVAGRCSNTMCIAGRPCWMDSPNSPLKASLINIPYC